MKAHRIALVFLLATTLIGCNDKPDLTLDANSSIMIAPNPVTVNVMIGVLVPGNQSYSIKVFDTKGKLLIDKEATGRYSFQLSLGDKPKGTYQVVLASDQTNIYKKFVKI